MSSTSEGDAGRVWHTLRIVYWRAAFDRRLAQNRALFAFDEHEQIFAEYAAWLCERRGAKVAAIRLDKDAGFFAELASLGRGVPTADVLIARFPPSQFARHRLVMHYLDEQQNVHLDANAKRVATDRGRIQALASTLPKGCASVELISDYRDRLLHDVDARKLVLLSARLYLRAALGLVQNAAARGLDRPDAAAARRYLNRHHGQRASLYPFLTFLGLQMPPDCRSAKNAARTARSRVRAALLGRLSKESADFLLDEQSMVLALQYFHNLSQADAHEIARKANMTSDGDWIILRVDEVAYQLPARLGETATDTPSK